jgi:hypothetical protein
LLHWSHDVAFREDDLRVCVGHASENPVLVRGTKRFAATPDDNYVLKVLRVNAYIAAFIMRFPWIPGFDAGCSDLVLIFSRRPVREL